MVLNSTFRKIIIYILAPPFLNVEKVEKVDILAPPFLKVEKVENVEKVEKVDILAPPFLKVDFFKSRYIYE